VHYRTRLHSLVLFSAILAAVLVLTFIPTSAHAASVGYRIEFVNGFGCHVVQINLGSPTVKVTPVLSLRYPGGAEPMSTICARERPVAAITGTFFSKTTLLPVGDIMIDGRLVHFGGMGSALAITPDNRATFRRIPWGRKQDWGPFETVMAAGPMLLEDGVVALAPAHERFRDPRVLGRASRTAVGLTGNNKLLMVATRERVSLWELAKIMRGLGCTHAINLDGGSSTGLYYRGSTIIKPARSLVNMLTVYADIDPGTRICQSECIQKRAGVESYRRAKAHEAYMMAQTPLAAGKLRQAVKLLDRAVELDPDNASYQVRLAETLEGLGNGRAAAGAWTRAGEILMAKERPAEALERFEAALEHKPGAGAARAGLIAACRELGMDTRAQALESELLVERLTDNLVAAYEDLIADVVLEAFKLAGREAPESMPGPSLAAPGAGGAFFDPSLGASLQLPACWDFVPTGEASALMMRHRYQPFLAHLRAAWAPENAMLDRIVELYWQGSFQDELLQTPVLRGTPTVDTARTETITMRAGLHCETKFFLRDGVVWILSLTTGEEFVEQAAPDFAAIAKSFRLF
jgi:tetratricopeptide (TPR) repeat protein